jgi:putative restriction endonuclease
MRDPDADIRLAAFQRLSSAARVHGGSLPWAVLKEGFAARGQRFLFASAAEGIFRPSGMSGVLSIKTVVPKPRGRVWYHDQGAARLAPDQDRAWYAFRGQDPTASRNQWLKEAMEQQLPLIYFFGVAPGMYEPIFPVFVSEWSPEHSSCGISFSRRAAAIEQDGGGLERRYAMRTLRQRLHQALFRERVLAAYGYRCALSGLPEPRLIDAAHIVPDGDELLGQPEVRNGICMSKIHHAAYDAGLIGIDPDMRIHVSERLLAAHDGPILELGIKSLQGKQIRLPDEAFAVPDRDRLAQQFAVFCSSDRFG